MLGRWRVRLYVEGALRGDAGRATSLDQGGGRSDDMGSGEV